MWLDSPATVCPRFFCAGSDLATGLINRPQSPTDCIYKIYSSRLTIDEKKTEGLIQKAKEEEDIIDAWHSL
jgi:hypothetical protein